MDLKYLCLSILIMIHCGCTALPSVSQEPEYYLAYPGTQETTILKTIDGLKLYGQWWEPGKQTPKAVIVLLHGTAAHAGVYAPWANYLKDNGYAMFAYDMRGWGQSQGFGRAGYTRDHKAYLRDLALAFQEANKRHPGVPIYLQGESLGAAIALQWDIHGGNEASGMILNAPPVVINMKLGPFRQPDWLSNSLAWNAGLIGRIAPNAKIFSMAGPTGKWVWKKAIFSPWAREWVENEINMIHSAIAASYVTNLQKITVEIRGNLKEIDKPMIILQGGKDYLVSPKAARRLAEKTSSPHTEWHLYEDRSHCALHDFEKEDVWHDIVNWLDRMTQIKIMTQTH